MDSSIDGLIAENPLTRPEEILTFLYNQGHIYSLATTPFADAW